MISDQGFVLHKRGYRDSSEIITLFCRQQGLLDVLAKGSLRPKSPFRNQLQPFIKTHLAFTGKSSLKTLTMAEQTGVQISIPYVNQVSLLYCNELLMLIAVEESTARLIYPHYVKAIQSLQGGGAVVMPLRLFEWNLSELMGYQLVIPEGLEDQQLLAFDPANGLVLTDGSKGVPVSTLRQFIAGEQLDGGQWRNLSVLMKPVVDHLVHGRAIRSRQLLK